MHNSKSRQPLPSTTPRTQPNHLEPDPALKPVPNNIDQHQTPSISSSRPQRKNHEIDPTRPFSTWLTRVCAKKPQDHSRISIRCRPPTYNSTNLGYHGGFKISMRKKKKGRSIGGRRCEIPVVTSLLIAHRPVLLSRRRS
ncbi:uncharacterized protein LOC107866549 [Capsicum annuum]|uniref:uncharacterized protein LOC107866549 n=1 Tax=Capsicum annuum TaxID=4072 RepID=UPI0007BED2F1|nr:uncharacterized protein LOC107866549 [Capsicum annuum]